VLPPLAWVPAEPDVEAPPTPALGAAGAPASISSESCPALLHEARPIGTKVQISVYSVREAIDHAS
jgi:hypothetical protein